MALSRLPAALAATLWLLVTGCTYDATQFTVEVDTDLRDRPLSIGVTVRSGNVTIAPDTRPDQSFFWQPRVMGRDGGIDAGPVRRADGGADAAADSSVIALPATFAVVPPSMDTRDGWITLRVEATTTTTTPAVTLRRLVRARFEPRSNLRLRVFLSAGCLQFGQGCARGTPCTVQDYCEQQGLTCGNSAECTAIAIDPRDAGMDAGGRVDARSDVRADSGADIVRDVAPVCPGAMEVRCAGTCVDLRSNAMNCGSCGRVCAVGEVCAASTCGTAPCGGGLTNCAGGCVDLNTSSAHCGRCGGACRADQACAGAACVCPGGTADCSGGCVQTSSNPAHCGRCDNPCAAGMVCSSGTCTMAGCAAGLTNCSGACVNTGRDDNHCGGCGTVCTGGRVCASGSCVCTSGQFCNGSCVDTGSNNMHCGSCGNACSGGTSCISGSCRCPGGQSNCGGTCRPTGAACMAGVGACERAGVIACSGTDTVCNATPGSPSGEVCNDADDNCDGIIDEDPACIECVPIPASALVFPLSHTGGDREFSGNGPDVTVSVTWSIAGNQIQANACVTMRETQSDWTQGTGCRTVTSVSTATAIDAILDPNFSRSYRDSNHNCDFLAGGAGVTGVTCIGDTGGDDICTGAFSCGSTDCSGCEVRFDCVRVRRHGS